MTDDENQTVWTNKSNWPRDCFMDGRRYTFLARALEQIGSTFYPIDWNGSEPSSYGWGLLPETENGANLKRQFVARILLRMVWTEFDPTIGKYIPLLEPGQWDEARIIAEAEHKSFTASQNRWTKTKEAAIEALAQGSLPYVLRYTNGELTAPLPPTAWNVDDAEDRFTKCEMQMSGQSLALPIFVPNSDLATLLTTIAGRLSPDVATPVANGLAAKPGNKSFDDEAALSLIKDLVTGDQQLSVWNAAWEVAENTPGQSRESTRTRLHGKFRARWPELVRGRAPNGA